MVSHRATLEGMVFLDPLSRDFLLTLVSMDEHAQNTRRLLPGRRGREAPFSDLFDAFLMEHNPSPKDLLYPLDAHGSVTSFLPRLEPVIAHYTGIAPAVEPHLRNAAQQVTELAHQLERLTLEQVRVQEFILMLHSFDSWPVPSIAPLTPLLDQRDLVFAEPSAASLMEFIRSAEARTGPGAGLEGLWVAQSASPGARSGMAALDLVKPKLAELHALAMLAQASE